MIEYLTGIISGIVANQLYDVIKKSIKWKRQRYVCRLSGTSEDEKIEKGLRVKTSNSDYGIEFYNLTDNPILVDYFDIMHKKKTIVGMCSISEEQQRISPSQKLSYILMEQDADALYWHCEKEHFTNCKVLLHTVAGKVIKVPLDVSEIALQIEISKGVESSVIDT